MAARNRRRLAALAVLALVAGCGSAASSGGSSAGSTGIGACGTVPNPGIHDPDNLVSTLPKELQAFYKGLPYHIQPSAYAHWKPSNPMPWTIGFLDGPLTNTYAVVTLKDMEYWAKKLEAAGIVKKFIADVAPDTTVAPQIQQFNSLIEQKVNLILVIPNSGPPLVPEIERAYKAGIATVTLAGPVDGTPDVVNWTHNPFLNGARPTAYIAKNYMHGKGNMLMVEGAPTAPTAIATLAGAEAALKECPGIKIINSTPLVGNYSNPVAKSVVLQFLSTYSGTVNGVMDGGTMAPGIISAFQQLGKTVPPMTNIGAIDGALEYFKQHESSGVGGASTGSGNYEFNRVAMDIAIRILEGKGPKLNDIIGEAYLITKSNLNFMLKYNTKNMTLNNYNVGEVPPFSLETSSELDGYFNTPGITAPVGLDSGTASDLDTIFGVT
jgi:ribose transport system substrate-binding protein